MDGYDLGIEVADMLHRYERDNPDLSTAARIKAAWSKAVSVDMAKHVTGVFVVPESDGGEVIVYADTSMHAADFNMQAEFLRLKLNLELAESGRCEPEQVRKLRFTVSKKRYTARKNTPSDDDIAATDAAQRDFEVVALDAAEESALETAASVISDERLREAALAAARASIEVKKGRDAAAS